MNNVIDTLIVSMLCTLVDMTIRTTIKNYSITASNNIYTINEVEDGWVNIDIF